MGRHYGSNVGPLLFIRNTPQTLIRNQYLHTHPTCTPGCRDPLGYLKGLTLGDPTTPSACAEDARLWRNHATKFGPKYPPSQSVVGPKIRPSPANWASPAEAPRTVGPLCADGLSVPIVWRGTLGADPPPPHMAICRERERQRGLMQIKYTATMETIPNEKWAVWGQPERCQPGRICQHCAVARHMSVPHGRPPSPWAWCPARKVSEKGKAMQWSRGMPKQ